MWATVGESPTLGKFWGKFWKEGGNDGRGKKGREREKEEEREQRGKEKRKRENGEEEEGKIMEENLKLKGKGMKMIRGLFSFFFFSFCFFVFLVFFFFFFLLLLIARHFLNLLRFVWVYQFVKSKPAQVIQDYHVYSIISFQIWFDEKLKWNRYKNPGVTSLAVSTEKIWMPDIVLHTK